MTQIKYHQHLIDKRRNEAPQGATILAVFNLQGEAHEYSEMVIDANGAIAKVGRSRANFSSKT